MTADHFFRVKLIGNRSWGGEMVHWLMYLRPGDGGWVAGDTYAWGALSGSGERILVTASKKKSRQRRRNHASRCDKGGILVLLV